MATINKVYMEQFGNAIASINVTINYTVDSTNPTNVKVTSTTMTVGAISVRNGSTVEQAHAQAAISGQLAIMSVSLTFGGQTIKSVTGITPSTTSAFSGYKTVVKGHSATTSPLVLNVYGGTTTTNISIPVKTSYTVKYNANSGDAAPSDQTKWYDETLTITSNIPSKTNYIFRGWSTTAARAGVPNIDYTSGQNYILNQGVELYAIWELAYQKPTISNIQINRCQQNGNYDDDGKYAKVTFQWSVFKSTNTQYYGAPSGSNTPYANNTAGSSTVTVGNYTATPTLDPTGTGTAIVGNGSFNADDTYDATISLTDTQEIVTTLADHTTTVTDVLSKAKFPIDINADATAIAFLTTAPDNDEGVFGPDMTSSEIQDFVDDLQVVGNGVVIDYIVDQGTSDIWTYRKWASGIAECWGITANKQYAVTLGYYNGWYANLDTVSFPNGLFTSINSLSVTRTQRQGVDAAGLLFPSIHSLSTSSFGGYIGCTASGNYNVQLSCHAMGRWK